MYINYLQLKNFRNYIDLELLLENKINIFLGNNAQGKTNIVEALYFLALAKSHRTSKEKELIKWGNSFSLVKGTIKNEIGDKRLEILLNQKGKKVKVNNLEKRKISEYIGNLNIVIFSPEDLNLIKGSPHFRRRFLDIEIGQINPTYLYHLSKYQKIIFQRNNLLKDFNSETKNKEQLLEVWNIQLIKHGAKIILKRLDFIKQLERWVEEIHYKISNKKEMIKIEYKSTVLIDKNSMSESEIIEQYFNHLKKNTKQEKLRGMTLIGPHRDDLDFYINMVNLQVYGSQGQQRSAALSLKLAEVELINEIIGEYPILLLDDVLSELDHFRQTHLINTIEKKVQTMITTTSIINIDIKTIQKSSVYNVENGKIYRK